MVLTCIVTAILYYDYALTLPMEIDRFWATRSISWASGFFYLNRYLTLLGHIPLVVWQAYLDSHTLNKAEVRESCLTRWYVDRWYNISDVS